MHRTKPRSSSGPVQAKDGVCARTSKIQNLETGTCPLLGGCKIMLKVAGYSVAPTIKTHVKIYLRQHIDRLGTHEPKHARQIVDSMMLPYALLPRSASCHLLTIGPIPRARVTKNNHEIMRSLTKGRHMSRGS